MKLLAFLNLFQLGTVSPMTVLLSEVYLSVFLKKYFVFLILKLPISTLFFCLECGHETEGGGVL